MESYMKDYDVTLRLGSVEKTYQITARNDHNATFIAKLKAALDGLPSYDTAEVVSCKRLEGY